MHSTIFETVTDIQSYFERLTTGLLATNNDIIAKTLHSCLSDAITVSNTYGLFLAAEIAFRTDDTETAVTIMKTALSKRPNDPFLIRNMAVYLSKNDLEFAVHYFEQALKLNPEDHWAMCGLGDCACAENDMDQAIIHHSQALKAAPDELLIRFRLAQDLLASNRISEAIIFYEKINADCPEAACVFIRNDHAILMHQENEAAKAPAENTELAIPFSGGAELVAVSA